MKLVLTALCASFFVIPAAFAKDCEKGKCDKEKQDEPALAKDCEKGKCDKEKQDEPALAACSNCKKGDEQKEDPALA